MADSLTLAESVTRTRTLLLDISTVEPTFQDEQVEAHLREVVTRMINVGVPRVWTIPAADMGFDFANTGVYYSESSPDATPASLYRRVKKILAVYRGLISTEFPRDAQEELELVSRERILDLLAKDTTNGVPTMASVERSQVRTAASQPDETDSVGIVTLMIWPPTDINDYDFSFRALMHGFLPVADGDKFELTEAESRMACRITAVQMMPLMGVMPDSDRFDGLKGTIPADLQRLFGIYAKEPHR